MQISLENWPSLVDLERAFYEKQSYESLLSYMAENKIANTESYFEEYKKVMETYIRLCKKLENEIIIPEVGDIEARWEVNFLEKFVTVREETN